MTELATSKKFITSSGCSATSQVLSEFIDITRYSVIVYLQMTHILPVIYLLMNSVVCISQSNSILGLNFWKMLVLKMNVVEQKPITSNAYLLDIGTSTLTLIIFFCLSNDTTLPKFFVLPFTLIRSVKNVSYKNITFSHYMLWNLKKFQQ